MPAIDSEFVQATGSTTTSTSFVDAGCSSTALTNGVSYLAIGFANHQDAGGLGYSPVQWSQCEARFGSTRLALSSWQSPFGNFAVDGAGGAQMRVAAVVDGDGASTLNMRVLSGAGDVDCVYASLSWKVIALDELTENTDYWVADSASGDTSEVAGTDDDDAGARLRLITDPSGSPSSATIGTEGEIFITLTGNNGGDTDPSLLAPTFYSHDVRALSASTEYTIRWEFRDESTWEQGDTDGQLTFTPTESGDYLIIASAEAFVSGGVVQYRRSRVFVLRLDALAGYEYIANGGGIQAGGNTVEGATGLTYDFGTATDALVLGCALQQGGTNWGRAWMRHDGAPDVDYPDADGTERNNIIPGDDAGSDIDALGFGAIVTGTGSQTWRLVAQSDSGGEFNLGRNRGDTADSRAVLVALQLETADTGPTGTMAPTLPIPTVSATGQRVETGTMAPALPLPTVASAGVARHVGSVAATIPLPTVESSGVARHQGQVATTLPIPTTSGSGTVARAGVIAASLLIPAVAASGMATPPVSGSAAASLPIPTMTGAGRRVEVGSMATSLPIPTMSAAGAVPSVASGAMAAALPLPAISATGVAQSEITGTASCSLPLPTSSSHGTVGDLGAFDASSLPLTTDAAGAGPYTTSLPTSDPLSLPLENL